MMPLAERQLGDTNSKANTICSKLVWKMLKQEGVPTKTNMDSELDLLPFQHMQRKWNH
jgi:hypothetical protein